MHEVLFHLTVRAQGKPAQHNRHRLHNEGSAQIDTQHKLQRTDAVCDLQMPECIVGACFRAAIPALIKQRNESS